MLTIDEAREFAERWATSPDDSVECEVCGCKPVVRCTGLCGPCTFGEADTVDGGWDETPLTALETEALMAWVRSFVTANLGESTKRAQAEDMSLMTAICLCLGGLFDYVEGEPSPLARALCEAAGWPESEVPRG